MNAQKTRIPLTVLPLLVLVAASACQPAPVPTAPWEDPRFERTVNAGHCTMYALISDPDHVYWVVCGQPPVGTLHGKSVR